MFFLIFASLFIYKCKLRIHCLACFTKISAVNAFKHPFLVLLSTNIQLFVRIKTSTFNALSKVIKPSEVANYHL